MGVAVSVATAVAAVAVAATIRTFVAGNQAKHVSQVPTDVLHDEFQTKKDAMAQRLSEAIQLRTISYDRPDTKHTKAACASFHDHGAEAHKCAPKEAQSDASPVDAATALEAYHARADVRATQAALLSFHSLLTDAYPKMHAALECTPINIFSRVYVWRGSDPSQQAVALYAHMDVVPADDGDSWTHPPFSGAILDGFVWGRGAIDDKQAVIGICEAVEHLVVSGFRPTRTVILMFGHDEEIGGNEGAACIAAWVEANVKVPGGKKPIAFLLDEGLFVLQGAVPGISQRTALICTAEKGFVNLELSVEVAGGHASSPPTETAVGVMAKAITKLEANPFPAHFGDAGPVPRMFQALLPYLSLPFRFIFSNLWLTLPLVNHIFGSNPKTATMVRTTTAPTIFQAGTKANTLPPSARAIVNHRIHPTETVASVVERDRRLINDPRVKLTPTDAVEPSPMSDDKAPAFSILSSAVEGLFANTVVAPGLMVGATDTHWSLHLVDNAYRHCPTELHVNETGMFHGRDERIRVDNLARIAAFYARVILSADTAAL